VQSPVYRTQAKSLVSWALPHVTARGAWLDVGAAFGLLLWQVRNDLPDWSLYAIEPAGDARDALAQLASVDTDFAAFWEGRSGPMAFYDVISLSHVLEHLLDPFSALRLLRERLKPGGLLVLEVPNDHRLELTRATRSSDLPHLWFFSGEGLRRVVELSGFEILREAELGLRRPGSRAPLHRRAARWLRRKLRGDLSLCDDGDWYAERPDRCNLRLLCRRSA
jgi:SAM-dependent methyltransferase